MDISKFLAKVIGVYLIIISIAMLMNLQQIMQMFSTFIYNSPIAFVAGCFTLIFGLLLVVRHNIWIWNWRVIITILGWIILLKGASIVLFPQFVDKSTMLFAQNINIAYLSVGLDFILGVLLSYFGFKR